MQLHADKRRPRLLIDAHIFDKERQGTTTYIKGLYNAFLERHGDAYELFFAAHDIEALVAHFPAARPEQFLRLPKVSGPQRLWQSLPDLLRRERIDWAHFQQIAPLRKSCRYITTVHDLLFNDFPEQFSWAYRQSRNYLFRRSLRQSELRFTVSRYSQQAIAQHYGLKDVAVTPNAVEAAFFEPYDKVATVAALRQRYGFGPYILYVSRIERRKNHLRLLEAFRALRLAEAGWHLVFVGREDLQVPELRQAIAGLSGPDSTHFHWLQHVPDGDLLQIYRGADLFVYPSLAEGFGIPPIEAAAVGVNTICAKATAMQDFDFLGDNLIDIGAPGALEAAIQQNMARPPSARILAERREAVRARYNWAHSADILEQNIREHRKGGLL